MGMPSFSTTLARARARAVAEAEAKFRTAEQLEISKRQYRALVKALAAMERGDVVHVVEYENDGASQEVGGKIGFNMNIWQCGTACCIGGLAEALSRDVQFLFQERPPYLADLLFPPFPIDYEAITVAQGAQALRNYLTTGNPGWQSIPGLKRRAK